MGLRNSVMSYLLGVSKKSFFDSKKCVCSPQNIYPIMEVVMKNAFNRILVILIVAQVSFAQRAQFSDEYKNHIKMSSPKKYESEVRETLSKKVYPKAPDSIMTAPLDSIFKNLDAFTRIEHDRAINNNWINLAINGSPKKQKRIGIQYYPPKPVITGVLYNSPAFKAGVCKDDTIISVNGIVIDASSDIDGIFGDIGQDDSVKISFKRGRNIYSISVLRDSFDIQDVYAIRKNKTICVSIKRFDSKTSEEFYNTVGDVGFNGVDSIIIDLRSNGGGTVSSTNRILELFLKKGDTICLDKKRNEDYYVIKHFDKLHPLQNIKNIIIRIDNRTASAAEMMAGCLKVKRNAIIVGDTSFGKGLMQELVYFGDYTLYVSVGEFFPAGMLKVHGVGIIPDILVKETSPSINNASASFVSNVRQKYPKPNSEIIRILGFDEKMTELVWPNVGSLYFLDNFRGK